MAAREEAAPAAPGAGPAAPARAAAGGRGAWAPDGAEARVLEAAAAHVAAGGLVAFPTETVWGLGADARCERAIERLRRWKGRGADQPVSVLVAGVEALAALGLAASAAAQRLAAAFWPGPLTLIVAGRPGAFAPGVARADGAVGVRCSPHPVAAALVAALGRRGVGPLTATSLNPHGAPPARTREEAARYGVRFELGPAGAGAPAPGSELDAVRGIGVGEDAGGAPPSTVVDCTGVRPVVLRAGAIEAAALAAALGEEIDTR